jgi:DNA-binding NtrC family response regulator
VSTLGGRVLVIDDERSQRDILEVILEGEGYEVTTAGNGRQALEALGDGRFDLALTDLKMPDVNGIALLTEMLVARPGLCVILMTAHGSIDTAVEAMRKGAFDYLTKPLERDELLLVLKRAMERLQLVRENRMLHEQLQDRFRIENLVGAHGSMQDVFRVVHKVARSDSPVLIHGESGTGKELVARALHHASGRRERPFYAANLPALPPGLVEAELFGHEKGVAGAEARRAGLFEQASGSTLFLDEVAELPRELQARLLAALQGGEILRGGGSEPVKVDVRVIASTSRDLEREVREGRFREDLYYGLSVVPIVLPALRERRTDVPLLVDHFLAKYDGGRRKSFSEAALKVLIAYDWPGNVRQLESVVERSVLLSEEDIVRAEDLPVAVRAGVTTPAADAVHGLPIPEEGIDLPALERALILRALEKAEGNAARAARLLGLSRHALQERLARLQAATQGATRKTAETA